MMIDDTFSKLYGAPPQACVFTPGRVNLIGEHTDYNGGAVLPTALNLGPTIALSPRDDDRVNIHSDKFEEIAHRRVSDSALVHWSDYAVGAVQFANKAGFLAGGADIVVKTTLPFGAGLSSSAAIIVGLLKVTRNLSASEMSDTDIAILARRVENEFIGVPCGIMDQMAVAIARPGQALALNTKTLGYDLVDLPSDYDMAVIHSGQFRELSEGRYKVRKEECDEVKNFLGREDICLMSDAEYDTLSGLPDYLKRRAKHCMTEHRRTVQASTMLQKHDMQAFGRLMNESHASQRDDFEISLPAVDTLVDDAVTLGALGARQTGGGFGGCIVACISKDKREHWQNQLLEKHPNAFYVC